MNLHPVNETVSFIFLTNHTSELLNTCKHHVNAFMKKSRGDQEGPVPPRVCSVAYTDSLLVAYHPY